MEVDLRENAELFFKDDCHVCENSYIGYLHPIYRKVFLRRLAEVGIPQKREIFPTKWASKANKL